MWFYLALLSAFFNSLSNVARRTHGSLAQPAELAWWSLLLSMPLSAGLLLVSGAPYYTSTAYLAPALIASALNAYGGVLMFKAYKYGDASVISPLTNFLPVTLVVTAFIILGTVPEPMGLVGILLVVAGVYYSSVSGRHSLAHPFRKLMANKGSRAMLGWVLLMSFSAALMGLALRSASPSYLMLFIQVVEFLLLSIYLLSRPQKHRIRHGEQVMKRWGWHIAAIATFTTLAIFFQLQAMNLQDISYVLSVKRIDVLFTILLAGLFLKEKHVFKRFKGSAIALVGVVIILLAG